MNRIQQQTVVVLQVNNHAGVMAHIVSLFARRGFNLEGILVLPEQDATASRIWLLVNKDSRVQQLVAQLNKLQDVQHINICDEDEQLFDRLRDTVSQSVP